jgi:hypothetical protein
MRWLILITGVLLFASGGAAGAQSLSYSSGQSVAPSYEGWEQDADGAKYFVFGYMNRNWEEEIDVAVGAANGFAPGNPDRGQPTHFLPRRNRFIFRVRVPDTFTEKDELVWTLTANGKTIKAFASLRVDYKLDDVVKASETGALGAGSSSPEIRANKPPIVTVVGDKTLHAKVGEPLTLTSVVTDDGIPKSRGSRSAAARAAAPSESPAASPEAGRGGEAAAPPAAAVATAARRNPAMAPPARITVGKNVGLHHAYYVFRGAGDVSFAPAQIKVWEDTRAGANSPWAPIWVAPPMPADGKVSAQVTFAEPGAYVVRSQADDGGLLGWDEVTVVVTR